MVCSLLFVLVFITFFSFSNSILFGHSSRRRCIHGKCVRCSSNKLICLFSHTLFFYSYTFSFHSSLSLFLFTRDSGDRLLQKMRQWPASMGHQESDQKTTMGRESRRGGYCASRRTTLALTNGSRPCCCQREQCPPGGNAMALSGNYWVSDAPWFCPEATLTGHVSRSVVSTVTAAA